MAVIIIVLTAVLFALQMSIARSFEYPQFLEMLLFNNGITLYSLHTDGSDWSLSVPLHLNRKLLLPLRSLRIPTVAAHL